MQPESGKGIAGDGLVSEEKIFFHKNIDFGVGTNQIISLEQFPNDSVLGGDNEMYCNSGNV
jgi:hypothetical protein